VAIKTALPMVQEEQSDGAAFDGDPCRRRDACCRLLKEIGNDGGWVYRIPRFGVARRTIATKEVTAKFVLVLRSPMKRRLPKFEFYFCSTRCLREFLNASLDALENKIIREFSPKSSKK
jgi:hypothetical protein